MSDQKSFRLVSLNASNIKRKYAIPDQDSYAQELQQFRQRLLESCSQWPKGFDTAGSPLPLLVPETLTDHLNELGDVLCKAVTSIVERWWTDGKAGFPRRMPVLAHQEEVLRWIDGEGRKFVMPFTDRKGSWRPDFLLQGTDLGEVVKKPTSGQGDDHSNDSSREITNVASKGHVNENHVMCKDFDSEAASHSGTVKICEINARFSFNGFFVTAYAHEAYSEKDMRSLGFKSPVNPNKIFEAFKGLLDLSKPIHLLKGTEYGLDIHLFEDYLRERCGLKVRFVRPEDLRLVPNAKSKTGSTLCCTLDPNEMPAETEDEIQAWRIISPIGESLEQVHQVGLELHQREMESLGVEMLKALAPVCFNDLRTIYLVHDKRMLGLVLQELDSLVKDHAVLTVEEANILRNGIASTFIPGSKQLQDLTVRTYCGYENKNDYLLKPVGSGKGKGIIFGTDVTENNWMESLLRLSHVQVEGQNYVVQRAVKQPKYEVIIPEGQGRSEVMRNNIVGTFMMVNGQHLGAGIWRTGASRICAVSHGGSWMHTVVPHAPLEFREKTAITINNVPRLTIGALPESLSPSHVHTIHTTLSTHGALILSLTFADPASIYLHQLVNSLTKFHGHNAPLSHSATHGYFWDVKPTPKSNSKPHHARSETMDDFPWHTDCSYAREPPRYFGLHVLQADRCGGGVLSVLELDKVLRKLDPETVEVLRAEEFHIVVPPEFANGTDFIVGAVLTTAGDGQTRCRFRADILKPLTERAGKALTELNRILGEARSGVSDLCLNLTPELLPNGSVVLLDNGRWLHARNDVKDPERHLRRIRWDAAKF